MLDDIRTNEEFTEETNNHYRRDEKYQLNPYRKTSFSRHFAF